MCPLFLAGSEGIGLPAAYKGAVIVRSGYLHLTQWRGPMWSVRYLPCAELRYYWFLVVTDPLRREGDAFTHPNEQRALLFKSVHIYSGCRNQPILAA